MVYVFLVVVSRQKGIFFYLVVSFLFSFILYAHDVLLYVFEVWHIPFWFIILSHKHITRDIPFFLNWCDIPFWLAILSLTWSHNVKYYFNNVTGYVNSRLDISSSFAWLHSPCRLTLFLVYFAIFIFKIKEFYNKYEIYFMYSYKIPISKYIVKIEKCCFFINRKNNTIIKIEVN